MYVYLYTHMHRERETGTTCQTWTRLSHLPILFEYLPLFMKAHHAVLICVLHVSRLDSFSLFYNKPTEAGSLRLACGEFECGK